MLETQHHFRLAPRIAVPLEEEMLMTKTALMATTGLLALFAAGVVPLGAHPATITSRATNATTRIELPKVRTLYTQNSNSLGVGFISDNFTSGTTTSSTVAADDFIVPKGKTWQVGEVDVTGVYFNGSGPATSENITFYKDASGVPGKTVKKGSFSALSCSDSGGSFSCTLPKKVRLKPGHYWVSVVANMNFISGAGEWGWEESSVIHNDPAVWGTCSGGVCGDWQSLGEDLMFDLKT